MKINDLLLVVISHITRKQNSSMYGADTNQCQKCFDRRLFFPLKSWEKFTHGRFYEWVS